MGLCRTVITTLAHLTHGVRTIVDALLRPRRFRSSGWLHPALCTLASSFVIAPVAGLGPVAWAANEPLPRSILILDQNVSDSVWYAPFSAAFRSILNAPPSAISVYAEHLDLNRFGGEHHDEVLTSYLRGKFRDRPIGVIVAQGSAALEFVLRARRELWPTVPVVFSGVDEETVGRLNLPAGVTGNIYQLPFRNMVTTAQALVPNLKRLALVGDPWEHQTVRRHYQEVIPVIATQFEFIDLIGLPMSEIRKRVAVLPDDTAIILMHRSARLLVSC